MDEIWKPITETNGIYEVSNLGRVKRAKPGRGWWATEVGRILKPLKHPFGYLFYSLKWNGKTKTRFIHQLLLEYFIGKRPSRKYVCNHKNGIPDDNRLENLEWVTQKENVNHAIYVIKKHTHGEKNGMHKLKEQKLKEILNTPIKHGIQSFFARKFGVSQTAIWYIIRRRNWKHLNDSPS